MDTSVSWSALQESWWTVWTMCFVAGVAFGWVYRFSARWLVEWLR